MKFVIYNTTPLLEKICVNTELYDSASQSIAKNLNLATSAVSVVSDAINDI
jgi:hypothetical protein